MRTICLPAAILLLCSSAFTQAPRSANPSSGLASDERALPHDRHDGLDVSADSYSEAARAKERFGKSDPVSAGILPVEVSIRNETNQPIRIQLNTIQLEVHPPGGQRQDLDWLTTQDVAAAIIHPGGPAAPHAKRFPIGIPTANGDKKVEKMAESLRPLTLDADVVPPMAMIHGFLFFDLSHNMALAKSSSLYIPDASQIPSNKALTFFEVPLGTAAER